MSDARNPVTVPKDGVVSEDSVSPSVLVESVQSSPPSLPVSSPSLSEPAETPPPVSSPKSEDPVQDIKLQNKDILYFWVVEDNPVNQKILLRVLGQVRAQNKETKQNATFKVRIGTGAQAVLDPLRVYAELEDYLALHPDDPLAKIQLDNLDKEFDRIAIIILDNTITSHTLGLTLIKLFRGMEITEYSDFLKDGYNEKTINRIREVIVKKRFHEKLIASHSNKLEKWNDQTAILVKDYIVDLAKGNFTPKTVIPALKEAKLGAKLEILASPIRDYKVSAAKESLVFEQVAPCPQPSLSRSASSTLLPVKTVSDPTHLAVIPEEDSDIGPKPLVRSQTSPISSTRSVGLSLLRDSKEKEHPPLHVEVPKHPVLPHSGSVSSPESDLSVVSSLSSRVTSAPSSRSSSSPSSLSSPASLFSPPPTLPTPPILSGSSSENGSDISPTKKSPGSVSPKELEQREGQPEQQVGVEAAEAEKQKQVSFGFGVQYS